MLEQEVKLSVEGAFAPAFPPGRSEVARTEELPALDLRASYYDTPDLRLARHGVFLTFAFAVAIGDSQTYGDEVAREQAWPQRLAALSGRSVYNLALGGYGPVEYDRLLPEALELSPRVVLVGLYAGNDFADAYLDAYPRALATELRSHDEALLARLGAL